MSTPTIFTIINISEHTEVELFLDALEESEARSHRQTNSAVEYIKDSKSIEGLIKKAESLDV